MILWESSSSSSSYRYWYWYRWGDPDASVDSGVSMRRRRRRLQKNAFGRWIPIPLFQIYLEVVAYGLEGAAYPAGLEAEAAAVVAVVETLKDDCYCCGNVVDFDFDSVADSDFDSYDPDPDLRGLSLTFEEYAAEDLGTVYADVVADVVVHAAADVARYFARYYALAGYPHHSYY